MIKKIIILKPKKSLNFSESCNAGIKNSKNDKIFIANDDIIISKNTLEPLYGHTNDHTITGPDSNCNLGFQTEYAYQVKGVSLVPAMTLEQVSDIIPDIYDLKSVNDAVVKREWLAFFAVMLTRNCLQDVGFLDESFVYDREDLDWCNRAKKLNKEFHQVFSSYCFHFGGVSRKRKHVELGIKHDLDQEHNLLYYQKKYNLPNQKPIIAFYCSDAWEYWDENSLDSTISDKPKGIGGSETQVILLSREFSKLGYKVKIFNKCKENHFDQKGYDVEYIPFQDFENYSKRITYDYFIASRYLDCYDIPFDSKRNFAMIHDVFLIMNGKHPHDVKKDKIEKYFCLSNRHMQFVHEYHNIPYEQLAMTSNGLDFDRFKNDFERNSKRLIYSSSPDRGLATLLPMFDKVLEEVPDAELHIYYGFENFRNQEYVKDMMIEIDKRPQVFYHGRIGQDVLAKEFQKSAIWAYPTIFEETFCITAIEAMAAGCVALSSYYWGLIDTVGDAGILLPMNDDRNTVTTKSYQYEWIQQCIHLLKNPEYAEEYRLKGFKHVQKFTWKAVCNQWHNYFNGQSWHNIQDAI